MTVMHDDRQLLAELDARLKTVLPPDYQETYETLQPAPMRAAGLTFDSQGRVAWDQIWGSFCDLAMAGGPPHKGALLPPGDEAAVAADPDRYAEVVEEICRGITLATDLPADESASPGWVQVDCYSETMAAWLLRAITMENVAVRGQARVLELPAAPAFRLDKEIKNVVTVVAKTSHYWMGHVPPEQRRAIGDLFAQLARETPLLQPRTAGGDARAAAARVQTAAGLPAMASDAPGWIAIECSSVQQALWMIRALVVSNILARREGTTLLVACDAELDPDATRLAADVARVRRLSAIRNAHHLTDGR